MVYKTTISAIVRQHHLTTGGWVGCVGGCGSISGFGPGIKKAF